MPEVEGVSFLKRIFKIMLVVLVVVEIIFVMSKGSDSENKQVKGDHSVDLAYVLWDTEIASTNVVKTVFEDLGYNVTMTQLDVAIMFEAISNGEADGMVAAWLPATHGSYYEEYKERFEDLGPNITGARIGLVVPDYMSVNDIDQLKDQADKTIVGIEPGAGIMQATERALESYPNLNDWTLESSSTGAMTSLLKQAYQKEEEIVITGWSPHWIFQAYDLKYLEDPKGEFGGEETINTLVRLGLKEDDPIAYQVLDRFNWTLADMESVMLEISEGATPEVAARNWVDNNQERVSQWIEGL